MPKISVHGGPTIASEVESPNPTSEAVEGEGEQPSPGNSSQVSGGKQPSSGEPSSLARQRRAPSAGSRSGKDREGESSTARSTSTTSGLETT